MARPKPLADLVGRLLGPSLAAQGFSGADVVASWAEIVGERLAARSRPLRVEWPRRRGQEGDRPEPATLVVRVEGAFALDLQHMAPLVMERINAVYGWRCIGRMVLKQGPVARPRPPAPARREVPDGERRRIAAAIAAVEEPPLRLALERLGCAVASRPEDAGGRGDPLATPRPNP